MELAELNQANLTEEHISYMLAPRMNALGRLDDANSMVELLTTADLGRARLLALELEGMNAQRKLLSDQVFQAAQAQINNDLKLLDFPVLVLSHPNWPAGVVGIVASRLVEQYHRPVILLAAPAGQDARGSARSIEGINITSAIAANQNLVKSFGGHPMAAGLAMDQASIPTFRAAMSRTIQQMGVEIQLEKELQVDGYLSLPELTLDLVSDFERLAPFGAGNPPLVFATRDLKLTGYVAVGRAGEHLQLTLEDELGHNQHAIWWQGAGYTMPEGIFDLAYSLRSSTYRGLREVQLEWIDYRSLISRSVSSTGKKRKIDVIDMRSEQEPVAVLNELVKKEAILVWGEAQAKTQIVCIDRSALFAAQNFAIWTIPPGPKELETALRLVNPNMVYLFSFNPGMDEPEKFLKKLLGLLKNSLNSSQGLTNLTALATATAHRIQTIQAGLEWMNEHGYIRLLSIKENEVRIEKGAGGVSKTDNTSARLNTLLAESAAFRRYYLTAQADRLVGLDE
jgi:single-stranded-DNA-specific exonuclease